MNQIDLIIFDCDGVLVDSEVIGNRIFAEHLTELGLPHTPEEVNDRYLGMSDETARQIIEATGFSLPDTFIDDVNVRTNEALARDLVAIPGIDEVLEALDMPFCVGSSGVPAKIRGSLTKTGLLSFFEPHLFSAYQVENGKPAPDLFLFAAKQMKAIPESVVVIEDSIAGVQAGVAAGMQVLGFTGGSHIMPGHDEKLRAEGARNIFDDMRELSGLLTAL